MVRFTPPCLVSNELDGMADHLVDSICDLLMTDSKPPSDFGCRQMVYLHLRRRPEVEHESIDLHKGHTASAPNGGSSPLVHKGMGREGELSPYNPWRKWLEAWQQETASM